MAQSTTNLGKIHVFPSETLYNQFKDIIADNDLALLKDDGAYIVAALLEQNGYVKFSNGLILQWGINTGNSAGVEYSFPVSFTSKLYTALATPCIKSGFWTTPATIVVKSLTKYKVGAYDLQSGKIWWLAIGV